MRQGFDTAIVCRKGHTINGSATFMPQFNKDFCSACGAAAMKTCGHCKAPIQGDYWGGAIHADPFVAPAHCHACGKPFPWTEARLRSISELLAMTSASPEDQAALSGALPALAAESPETPVAIAKWKRFLVGGGRELASSFRDLLVDIMGEAAKRKMFGP